MHGDLTEFESFVAARQQRLFRVAFLLTRDHQRAEDLLQDAFVKVYRRWRQNRGSELTEAYVRKVLLNTYISTRRIRRESEMPSPQDVFANLADSDPLVDERIVVWRALGVLTPRQRAVIVLRIYEGMSDDEIAEHLDCATGTVRSLASRAYLTLRDHSALLDRAPTTLKGRHRGHAR